jgi:hypothetical protein
MCVAGFDWVDKMGNLELPSKYAAQLYRRFARAHELGYSCRPVSWEELPADQRTPAPGPKHFVAMLTAAKSTRPEVLQFIVVLPNPLRPWKSISLAHALSVLQEDLVMGEDLVQYPDVGAERPSMVRDHHRLRDGLCHMVGEKALQEFLDIEVDASELEWEEADD